MNKIKINLIKIDGGTQRRQLDTAISDHYAALMKDGVKFPPIELVHTGKFYYVWDGFHRLSAAEINGFESIEANVRNGTLEDAIWLSYSANTTHGLPRKPGEVKKAIEEILANPKWSCKTDKEICEHINCDRKTVERIRKEKQTENVRCCDNVPLSVKPSPELPKGRCVAEFEDETPPHKEPECLKDKKGNAIPVEIRDLWVENAALNVYINQLNQIKRDIDDLVSNQEPKIRLLWHQSFTGAATHLKAALNGMLFYALCPYCEIEGKGIQKNCKACKGTGFVNKLTYDAAPKDKKQEEEF